MAAAAGAFAAAVPLGPGGRLLGAPNVGAVALLAIVFVGGYLLFGVGAAVRALRDRVGQSGARALAGPCVLWLAVVLYAARSGLAVLPRAATFGAYLFAPALLLVVGRPAPWAEGPPGRPPVRELAAVALLWLPIEFRLLASLPVPTPAGYDVARFAGLVDALWLFLVARPLPDVGYTFAFRWRDGAAAVRAFLLYAAIALPLGLATGFIAWHPRVTTGGVVLTPLLIYLAIAVPEEFLFRGLVQNLLTRWWGPARALPAAAVVFGLAHLPDPRYVLLATFAGLAYGWVYQRTGQVMASAITHALVDATWSVLLRR